MMERRPLPTTQDSLNGSFSSLFAPGPVHRPLIPYWVSKYVQLSVGVCVLCGLYFTPGEPRRLRYPSLFSPVFPSYWLKIGLSLHGRADCPDGQMLPFTFTRLDTGQGESGQRQKWTYFMAQHGRRNYFPVELPAHSVLPKAQRKEKVAGEERGGKGNSKVEVFGKKSLSYSGHLPKTATLS